MDSIMASRLSLAKLPTPICKLDRLSAELGVNLYIKRDDFSGLELSGNKIRKLEYNLAEAQKLGADTIITTGAIQSNHCRATAFAAKKSGFQVILVLRGDYPHKLEGNTFLDLASGAQIVWIPPEASREESMLIIAQKLEKKGRKPYLIPVGASNALGSQGYRQCFQEILEQEKSLSLQFDVISLAVGSGGTFAGLWYENQLLGAGRKILGFSVSDTREDFTQDIRSIVKDMRCMDHLAPFDPEPDFDLNDEYIGKGYAQFTQEEVHFLMDIAMKESIVFDPCYTGKAFSGLYHEIKKGHLSSAKDILFIHTGGLFGWTSESRKLAFNYLTKNFTTLEDWEIRE